MSKHSPCHNCPERFLACSDRCPKDARGEYGYKAWREHEEAEKKHLKDTGNRWAILGSEARDKIRYSYSKGPTKG